jgi:hypothetical protein
MGLTLPTLSPISHANDWMFFTLGGWPSPGTIAKDGVKGFKRETGWDIKKGKGTQGATLTLTTLPPVKGSFTLQLFTDADFAAWDEFVSRVLSIDVKQQQAEGLAIYYPAFSSIGLTTVVIAHYEAPIHKGRGMYHTVIDILEWQKPPPSSVVSTVAGTKPDQNPPGPTPQDPRVAALQKQIDLINQAIKAAGAP